MREALSIVLGNSIGTGAMLAAAVVLALASAPHRSAAAKQGTFPLLAASCTIAALLG